jgi:hypothetical protein
MQRLFLSRCLFYIPILVCLSNIPGVSWAAGAHVQSCKDDVGSATTQACTMTVTAGNGLAVWAALADTAQSISSVSDGVNTYQTPAGCSDFAARGLRYALNIAGGSTTITVTFSSSNNGYIVVHEFSGADTFDACAGINSQVNPGTGTDAITSTAATVGSNAYIFAATAQNCCPGGTTSAGTNFTQGQTLSNGGFLGLSEYWDNTAGGSLAGTFTTTAATSTWRTGMMSFVQSSATTSAGSSLGWLEEDE